MASVYVTASHLQGRPSSASIESRPWPVSTEGRPSSVSVIDHLPANNTDYRPSVISADFRPWGFSADYRPSVISTEFRPSIIDTTAVNMINQQPSAVSVEHRPSAVSVESRPSMVSVESRPSAISVESRPSAVSIIKNEPPPVSAVSRLSVVSQVMPPPVTIEPQKTVVSDQSPSSVINQESRPSLVKRQSHPEVRPSMVIVNEESILEEQFYSKKTIFCVGLTKSGIRWTADSSPYGDVNAVPYFDVIGIRPLNSPDAGFEVHYVNRVNHPKWSHVYADFYTEDAAKAKNFTQKLQELHSATVSRCERPRKLLVYINPGSGAKKGLAIYEKLVGPIFSLAGLITQVIVTERAGHIKDHLMSYDTSQIDGVVIVGGDGTFAEAAEGLVRNKMRQDSRNADDVTLSLPTLEVPIGVIPAGTGQGTILRAAGTDDVTTAALHIILGQTCRIDGFTVHDDSRLVSIGTLLCGFGFYSTGVEASEATRWMGRGRYMWGFMKSLSSINKFQAEVQAELVQRNEDGSIKDNSQEPECKVVGGKMVEVTYLQFDMANQRSEPGVMYVHIFKDNATRKGIMSHLGRFAKQKPNTFDFDFIERMDVFQYKIVLDRNGPSGKNAKTPVSINIDGDPHPISGNVIHVRATPNAVRLYGHGQIVEPYMQNREQEGQS